MSISWSDTRLKWNQTEWKTESFLLHNNHHIWTPLFTDDSVFRSCSPMEGCISSVNEVEVFSDGKVKAQLTFRYPSFCGINFYDYPEETNDCCLLLSIMESERKIEFILDTKIKEEIDKAVAITDVENRPTQTIFKNIANSAWKVENRVLDVVKTGGIRSQMLKLCIHAKKDMATLKVALRIPATIATLLMLASPLFGDLRTQVFVKVKRTVPPSHNLYLMAKLINRFVCCTEPDPATSYSRYLEDSRENGGTMEEQRPDSAVDHTMEWRHLYIAANNLLAGISFSIFCMVVIFDIL
ncbi:hypothetical protein FO519_008422 [Halicephalobus sp. NKZ332]|nr:hypothetical protein FO519_008422 [Halicephalobus sp. NKZ332]